MNTKSSLLIFFIFLCLLICSCRDKMEKGDFEITIDSVIKETDSIHVFYTTNQFIEFSENLSFWSNVKGCEKNQKTVLQFPKNVFPKQIRIDFGNNIKQQEIVLNKINFQFKDKSFSLQGKEIYYYFRIDESVTELDKELGTLKRRDSLQTRGPSLYPKGDNLFNKLSKFQND